MRKALKKGRIEGPMTEDGLSEPRMDANPFDRLRTDSSTVLRAGGRVLRKRDGILGKPWICGGLYELLVKCIKKKVVQDSVGDIIVGCRTEDKRQKTYRHKMNVF